MKKGEVKKRVSVSISPEVLKELDDYCSKIKPVPADRSPVIEVAIREYLGGEKK